MNLNNTESTETASPEEGGFAAGFASARGGASRDTSWR